MRRRLIQHCKPFCLDRLSSTKNLKFNARFREFLIVVHWISHFCIRKNRRHLFFLLLLLFIVSCCLVLLTDVRSITISLFLLIFFLIFMHNNNTLLIIQNFNLNKHSLCSLFFLLFFVLFLSCFSLTTKNSSFSCFSRIRRCTFRCCCSPMWLS